METLLLGPDDVDACIDVSDAIVAVEDAFAAHHRGESVMPAKSYIDLPDVDGDFRAMPAYVDDGAGVKWVNSHPDNPTEHGLPTVMGVMIYSDPATAFPLAVIDGTTLTRIRTGAAAGVATDHLARDDAATLGLVGAGAQAHTQLEAVAAVRDLDRVVVADRSEEAIEAFLEREGERDLDVVSGSVEDAAGCDVVSTTTPSREPVVERDWVRDGAHVNAMGADAEGKQELDPAVLRDAVVVIDDWAQCRHSGEINVPLAAGDVEESDVHGEIGAVVTGDADGRTRDDQITVFDSTGLAIQDVAASRVCYERADAEGIGTPFALVDTALD
jgi:alanine dehydrogenase